MKVRFRTYFEGADGDTLFKIEQGYVLAAFDRKGQTVCIVLSDGALAVEVALEDIRPD